MTDPAPTIKTTWSPALAFSGFCASINMSVSATPVHRLFDTQLSQEVVLFALPRAGFSFASTTVPYSSIMDIYYQRLAGFFKKPHPAPSPHQVRGKLFGWVPAPGKIFSGGSLLCLYLKLC